MFLGLNAGVGAGLTSYSFGALFSAGIDYAFPITDKFGLGVYGSYDGIIEFEDGYLHSGGSAGIFTTLGNCDTGKKAFVGGLGLALGENEIMFDLRGGVLFKNGLYIMGDISVGSGSNYVSESYYMNDSSQSNYYYESAFTFNACVRIGYNFGKFIKIRKRR